MTQHDQTVDSSVPVTTDQPLADNPPATPIGPARPADAMLSDSAGESAAAGDSDRPRGAWELMIEKNPDHSRWYVERFRQMAADGKDLHGEARFVDAMVPRGARILDAGSGPGRLGGELARLGHDVVGIDVDPYLIEAAKEDFPAATWITGDLFEMDLPARGIEAGFDIIVAAGNVITFLAPGTAPVILARMRDHLKPGGRIVIGFGAGRGYELKEFLADAAQARLTPDVMLESWDLRALEPDSGFVVAILRIG